MIKRLISLILIFTCFSQFVMADPVDAVIVDNQETTVEKEASFVKKHSMAIGCCIIGAVVVAGGLAFRSFIVKAQPQVPPAKQSVESPEVEAENIRTLRVGFRDDARINGQRKQAPPAEAKAQAQVILEDSEDLGL